MNYHVIMYMYNNSIVEGSVAQWLEQGTHKPKVVGSNPTRAIINKLLKNKLIILEKWLSGRKQ